MTIQNTKPTAEYIVVADQTLKVLFSTTNWNEAVRTANMCRKAGGEITVFKATRI